MRTSVQAWVKTLNYMLAKSKNGTFSILYPSTKGKIARDISDAAAELGLKPIKLEINPFKVRDPPPKYLANFLDNLKENDFLVVIRGKNFINNFKLHSHFNTSSGLTTGKARSIVLHNQIEDVDLTSLCDIDYQEVVKYSQSIKRKLELGKKIRIITDGGTDISCKPREWRCTQIKPDKTLKNATLPVGQIYAAVFEKETNGKIVIDKCISNFIIDFKTVISFPEIRKKITLEIKEGEITKIEGDKEAEFLRQTCLNKIDNGGRILSEIAFGLNPNKIDKRNFYLQEVLRDTTHFGFGLNTHLGGDIVSNTHWDAAIK
ncbi:MAG: aminopeptidase [Candidatus Heimdallarchaeaceae archaeon]